MFSHCIIYIIIITLFASTTETKIIKQHFSFLVYKPADPHTIKEVTIIFKNKATHKHYTSIYTYTCMLAKQLSAAFKDILSSRQQQGIKSTGLVRVTVQYCIYIEPSPYI